MRLAILKETKPFEKRVALAPDAVKKLISMGFDVNVEAGAGVAANFSDQSYEAAGAAIKADANTACIDVDVIAKIRAPQDVEAQAYPKGAILLAHMDARADKKMLESLAGQGLRVFALELMPRITRAQAMDILSSQANIAGYRAVFDAIEEFGRALPMMMTAAGTVAPARVFIMGVGVAGLQAIATARRCGAIVSATDVRAATKEQVESLGASFVAVEDEEFANAQTQDGYAKEMSDAYKQKQAELVAATIAKQDIVITTALIPGRQAPILITQEMVESMKPGAVIVDMAVEAGGNCALSQFGEVITHNSVTIIGHANYPARVAETTSALFGNNIINFLKLLVDVETKSITINHEDEIIVGTLICDQGEIIHPEFRAGD
ncbi:MAG: Re/Si-specific NAD(P)(+) transhydrogenase subunit alpha [Pseudomonadota bacterium]